MANILTCEDRILTTHAGALPRSAAALELIKAKAGENFDPRAYEAQVSAAVEACVRIQAESGIDIVADGEEKSGFALYVEDRLAGLEPRPQDEIEGFRPEQAAFLEDFEQYLHTTIRNGAAVARMPVVCAGPIEYVGQEQLQRDLDNLKSAAAKVGCSDAFMPSIAPSGVGANAYYPSDEEFLYASGEALRDEYNAIVDAGFMLQIDDPFLPAVFADRRRTPDQADRRARAYVDALNNSLRGIPPEKVRYHIRCSGLEAGPRQEVPFREVARHMLRVNAAAYSFDAGRVRHEDDEDLWDMVRLPEGKVIMPGLVTHSGNHVEDPQDIADRLVRFASRVGRDHVLASVDHRVSPGPASHPEVSPTLLWSKFEALRQGAELASRKLWA